MKKRNIKMKKEQKRKTEVVYKELKKGMTDLSIKYFTNCFQAQNILIVSTRK